MTKIFMKLFFLCNVVTTIISSKNVVVLYYIRIFLNIVSFFYSWVDRG